MVRKKTTGKFKLKTHKSTSKRFRMTGTGKIVRTKGGQSHFRRRRSKRAKRQYGEMLVVESPGIQKRIRRLAPYLGKYRTTPTARTAK